MTRPPYSTPAHSPRSTGPYKPAVTPEVALDILEHERRAGRFDGDLLALFVDAKVYEVTRPRVRAH